MSILLLGQAPSATSGAMPLDGRSGRRLSDLAGIGNVDVSTVFAVGNLLGRNPGAKDGEGDRFPLDEERRNALAMMELLAEFDAIVLLGRNVARVFGAHAEDYFRWMPCLRLQGWLVPTPAAVMPHPSGVSRWWNAPGNVERAADFMRRLTHTAVQVGLEDAGSSVATTYADGVRV